MRFVTPLTLGVGLALVILTNGCRRDSSGGPNGSRPPKGEATFDSGPPRTYEQAVLRARTCPTQTDAGELPLRDPIRGCESCKPGEHCKTFSYHGVESGQCQRSTCEKDADCGGRGLCRCGPPNECVVGNCRDENDCGGRECRPDRWRYGHGEGSFCRTKDDTCTSHDACGTGKECAYVRGAWRCRDEVRAPPPG